MPVELKADEFKSKEYRTWGRMIARCHSEDHPKYPWYGARGITVCQLWRDSYRAFLEHMGRAPSPAHSIERLDNDDGYRPGNCVWATMKQQAQNRRGNRNLTRNGVTMTVAAWADTLQMDRRVLWKRLAAGWELERALSTPKAPRTKRAAA